MRPETPEQVGEALRFAAAEGIGVAVRSGGHGGGHFDIDGGLVIELSNFTRRSRSTARTVRIGGGAVWGDVAAELAKYDLGLTSGDTKSVGVGGLTLGGGVGWLVREHGLAFDSLIAAEVVLASGEVVTASADEHPDLFWALRGGGGNFGVVTTFVFEAHPLDGVVFGTLTYDVAQRRRGAEGLARRHARGAREVQLDVPGDAGDGSGHGGGRAGHRAAPGARSSPRPSRSSRSCARCPATAAKTSPRRTTPTRSKTRTRSRARRR